MKAFLGRGVFWSVLVGTVSLICTLGGAYDQERIFFSGLIVVVVFLLQFGNNREDRRNITALFPTNALLLEVFFSDGHWIAGIVGTAIVMGAVYLFVWAFLAEEFKTRRWELMLVSFLILATTYAFVAQEWWRAAIALALLSFVWWAEEDTKEDKKVLPDRTFVPSRP